MPELMDKKEQAEREEAAAAYAQEDEQHFVTFCHECIDHSVKSKEPVRERQAECWAVFNEEPPASYAHKEPWQARTVLPKPYGAVLSATAAVKKAFSPDFLSIKDEKDPIAAAFWQRVMERQLDPLHSDFVLAFLDALMMSLAVGESMEMIPKFLPDRGLKFDLVEPWKIHRDPDAPSRDPQGGMYWIHQEWLDFFILREGEENGKYFDVDRVKSTDGVNPSDPFMTEEAVARRKKEIWQASKFRKKILVSEYWGMVLDKRGEILLPSATYTVAGGRVIEKPRAVKYARLRWPGVSFSPLPGILTHGGRGLLEGVSSVWEAMNNLMCLHEDALKWLVNPPMEIDVHRLEDSEDVECFPGKNYLVAESLNGNQAIRPLTRRDNTNSVLANLQYYDQSFQRGAFVTDAVQGLPGYRQEQTAREAAMLLDQSMGPFSIMGANIEQGAMQAVSAARDVVQTYAGYRDYLAVFDEQQMQEFGIRCGESGVLEGLPELTGSFHISGVQALFRDQETLSNLKSMVIPLAGDPRFGKYIRPFRVLKALEERTNLADEKIFVDEEIGNAMEVADLAQTTQAAMEPPQPPEGMGGMAGAPGSSAILAKMAGNQGGA